VNGELILFRPWQNSGLLKIVGLEVLQESLFSLLSPVEFPPQFVENCI
jgi:hypothetical protein